MAPPPPPPRIPCAVTAVGLATSLGVDWPSACAAARAGITRVADGAYAVVDREAFDVIPVSGHPVGTLTTGFAELGLWVRLGSLALADLLRRATLEPSQMADTAFLVACPSDYALAAAASAMPPGSGEAAGVTFRDLAPYYAAELVPKLLRTAGLPAPRAQEVLFEDEMGFPIALGRAMELLASGAVQRCIVGGVDSLLEPQWLAALHDLGALKTSVRPTGLMPGEGAAFLLIEAEGAARRRKAPVLAGIGIPAMAMDVPRQEDPGPRGRVLADVIRASLTRLGRGGVGFLCDLNGESARAQEWGSALVRLQPDGLPGGTIFPAIGFGETRAAYGPLAACLAVHAFTRNRPPPDALLVWAAADRGGRASFVLTRRSSS